ncbi:MAG: hypothetical protein M1120_00330 [Patescibacteria group bacterium]|nr:hypothetical protein [Patescibacteria group bacterium]
MYILENIYNSVIRKHKDATSFMVLLFFLLTFVVSRTYIYLNTVGIVPDNWFLNRSIRGVHIHHLAFGIVILTISGYLALIFHSQRIKHYISALYGVGLGLAYDEFGMWLHLRDNYWIRQSYDAIAIITVLLINIVYFGNLWQKIFYRFWSSALRVKHKHSHKLANLSLPRRQRE